MSQISRPFQIALAAVALLALVWVVALHRPSSSSNGAKASAESPSPSVAPATTPTASTHAGSGSGSGGSAGSSGSGSSAYHGSAPGVEGLSKAIAKAHGAVATSQLNAKQLQEKSEQASSNGGEHSAGSSASSSSSSAAAPRTKTTNTAEKATGTTTSKATVTPKATPKPASTSGLTALERRVERELAHGDVVALLFWSPKGADDRAVRGALRRLAGSDRSLAVHVALAKQVASFGTITRGIQVYGTPTVLVVGKHGHTQVLTGLQDAFAIRQAVAEAR